METRAKPGCFVIVHGSFR